MFKNIGDNQNMFKKTIGFMAICRCSAVVGVAFYGDFAREDIGRSVNMHLDYGCTIKPLFEHACYITVELCRCKFS